MRTDVFVVSAAAERLHGSVLGPYVDEFCVRLAELGYPPASIRSKLGVLSGLACWMEQEQVAVAGLDERRTDEFLAARRRRGRTCRGYPRTLLQMLALLREAGVVRAPVPVIDDSPAAALLARYEGYLRRERGLADVTVAAYLRVVRALVLEHIEITAQPARLDAQTVRDFLRVRARVGAPRTAQGMASALRSFLRFLFLRGETAGDLALCVPPVRQWRQAQVPRYLAAPDVERLLDACDRASASGRRDHAILLLLARLGLRAGEVVALELGDLRWREAEIVVRGKGGFRDRLPLPPDVGAALAVYLRTDRPPGASRRVFLCARAPHRGFAHPSSVTTIVTRRLGRAGLAPPTRGAHLLRHGLATSLLRGGASLIEIGELLRHRSPATTEIYAKLDLDALRDVGLAWPLTGGAR